MLRDESERAKKRDIRDFDFYELTFHNPSNVPDFISSLVCISPFLTSLLNRLTRFGEHSLYFLTFNNFLLSFERLRIPIPPVSCKSVAQRPPSQPAQPHNTRSILYDFPHPN